MSVAQQLKTLYPKRLGQIESALRKRADQNNLTESEAFGKKRAPNLGTDTLLTGWTPTALPFTRFTDKRQRQLVARSRDVILNTNDGKSAARVIRHNVIGERGVRMQSQVIKTDGTPDFDRNTAIETAWEAYCNDAERFDQAGENTLYDLQIQAINSIITDGEVFVRRHVGADGELKWSLLDPMRIPPGRSSFVRPVNEKQVYKNGIIFDKETDKRLFYAVNPDDIYRYSDRIDHASHVPAADIFHAFIKEGYIGQKRGIPIGHTTFVNLYLMEKYIEAAVVNARVSAAKLGWLSKTDDDSGPVVEYQMDENGEPVNDEDGNMIPIDPIENAQISTEPGSVNWLPSGVNFSAWETDYPDAQFDSFTKVGNRKTASGFAIPYADLTGDLSDVNYSSIRQGALEIRENYKMLQRLMVWILNEIYMEWLLHALMEGILKVNGRTLTVESFADCCKPQWTPRRWPWIDPQAEARANQIAVQTGLRSVSQIIREMGGDPDETWKSISQDIEKMRENNIPEPIIWSIYAQKGADLTTLLEEIENASSV